MRRYRQTAHFLFHKLSLEIMSTDANGPIELEASAFRLLSLAHASTERGPGGWNAHVRDLDARARARGAAFPAAECVFRSCELLLTRPTC